MMATSTSLTVVRSPSRLPVKRTAIIKHKGQRTETSFQEGLSASQDDVIEGEFHEILGNFMGETPPSESPYEQILTPRYLFKSRFVNYYA
jgi:hypothetical protein